MFALFFIIPQVWSSALRVCLSALRVCLSALSFHVLGTLCLRVLGALCLPVALFLCLYADLVLEGSVAIAPRAGIGRRVTSIARGVERERESWRGRSSRAPRSVAVERACKREREKDGEEDGEENEAASFRERESENSFERAHKFDRENLPNFARLFLMSITVNYSQSNSTSY